MSAYCACAKCCARWAALGLTASGRPPVQGKTVAADTSVWPMGACLEIEGVGRRWVHDVGGAIKGRALDVFYESHEDALRFGRRELKVRGCR